MQLQERPGLGVRAINPNNKVSIYDNCFARCVLEQQLTVAGVAAFEAEAVVHRHLQAATAK